MTRRPPASTRTGTLFPSTTLVRSLHAGWRRRQGLAGVRPPATVVARLFLARHLFGTHRVEFFLAGVAVVRRAGIEHLLHDRLVTVEALRLVDLIEVGLQAKIGRAHV